MLPRDERLPTTAFDVAFRAAVSIKHPLMQLRAVRTRASSTAAPRSAFVVPKKQGKATARNRLRRRLRECYRLHEYRHHEALRGFDLIFLTTPAAAAADGEALAAALESVLRRLIARGAASAPPPRAAATLVDATAEEPSVRSGPAPESVPEAEALEPVLVEPGLVESGLVESGLVESGGVTFPGRESGVSPADPAEPQDAARPRPRPFSPEGLALTLISLYQRFISPGLPPSCRFYPTCSRYTYEAIELHGLWRGGLLGLGRVCRCHPWNAGGFDPVPDSVGFRRGPRQGTQDARRHK